MENISLNFTGISIGSLGKINILVNGVYENIIVNGVYEKKIANL